MIKDPEQKSYVFGENESLQGKELPSSYYHATIIFLVGIILIAILGNFPDLLPHFADAKGKMKAISMTTVIQIIMLLISAIILFVCKTKAKESETARSSVRGSSHWSLYTVSLGWRIPILRIICRS